MGDAAAVAGMPAASQPLRAGSSPWPPRHRQRIRRPQFEVGFGGFRAIAAKAAHEALRDGGDHV